MVQEEKTERCGRRAARQQVRKTRSSAASPELRPTWPGSPAEIPYWAPLLGVCPGVCPTSSHRNCQHEGQSSGPQHIPKKSARAAPSGFLTSSPHDLPRPASGALPRPSERPAHLSFTSQDASGSSMPKQEGAGHHLAVGRPVRERGPPASGETCGEEEPGGAGRGPSGVWGMGWRAEGSLPKCWTLRSQRQRPGSAGGARAEADSGRLEGGAEAAPGRGEGGNGPGEFLDKNAPVPPRPGAGGAAPGCWTSTSQKSGAPGRRQTLQPTQGVNSRVLDRGGNAGSLCYG